MARKIRRRIFPGLATPCYLFFYLLRRARLTIRHPSRRPSRAFCFDLRRVKLRETQNRKGQGVVELRPPGRPLSRQVRLGTVLGRADG